MEHICLEAQLCSEISIFEEKSNLGYTDHPEISTSLGLRLGTMGLALDLGNTGLGLGFWDTGLGLGYLGYRFWDLGYLGYRFWDLGYCYSH